MQCMNPIHCRCSELPNGSGFVVNLQGKLNRTQATLLVELLKAWDADVEVDMSARHEPVEQTGSGPSPFGHGMGGTYANAFNYNFAEFQEFTRRYKRAQSASRVTVAAWRRELGFAIDEPVTVEAVKARYRELAKQHHPDRGGSTEKMAAINAAKQLAIEELGA